MKFLLRFCIFFTTSIFLIYPISQVKAQILNEEQLATDSTGVTSLMAAASINDIDGVKFFSKAGEFVVNQKNLGGATALNIAVRNGNLEIVQILIENGADLNLSDNEGYTPLMRAAIENHPQIFSLLLKSGANPILMNASGESAIIHAANSDCKKCLEDIFSSSDILKNMETKLLIDQLSSAYVIANNRDNKNIQDLLDIYLKIVAPSSVKAEKVVNNEDAKENPASIAPDKNLNNNTSSIISTPFFSGNKNIQSSSVKKYKLQRGEDFVGEELDNETSFKNSEAINDGDNNSSQLPKSIQQSSEIPQSNPKVLQSDLQSDNLIQKKRFKFIVGDSASGQNLSSTKIK